MTPAVARERKRAAERALDAWVLGLTAEATRESCPDDDAAFSAFLSEIAGDPYLSKMEYAKVVRVGARPAPRRP